MRCGGCKSQNDQRHEEGAHTDQSASRAEPYSCRNTAHESGSSCAISARKPASGYGCLTVDTVDARLSSRFGSNTSLLTCAESTMLPAAIGVTTMLTVAWPDAANTPKSPLTRVRPSAS